MYNFKTKKADGQSLVHLINLSFGDELVGAEVGAANALTTCTLLQSCPSLKLYVIDSWKPFQDFMKEPYDGSPCIAFDEKQIDFYKLTAFHNIKYSGCADRAFIMEMDSNQAASQIENDSLDFVFLDAHLTIEQLENDMRVWYRKIRKGGLFAIHDADIEAVFKSIENFIIFNNIKSKISNFDRTFAWFK